VEEVTRPPVAEQDMWVMLLSTIRYAMGRSSYITGLSCDLVKTYEKYLRKEQLEQIRREILEELRRHEEAGATLGMQMDHDGWTKFAADLQGVIDARR
jgi:hypothetical protein